MNLTDDHEARRSNKLAQIMQAYRDLMISDLRGKEDVLKKFYYRLRQILTF